MVTGMALGYQSLDDNFGCFKSILRELTRWVAPIR